MTVYTPATKSWLAYTKTWAFVGSFPTQAQAQEALLAYHE